MVSAKMHEKDMSDFQRISILGSRRFGFDISEMTFILAISHATVSEVVQLMTAKVFGIIKTVQIQQ